MNGNGGVKKQTALVILAIALANFLILNTLRPGGLMAYVLPSVSWAFLAAVVLKACGLSRIKSWFNRNMSLVAGMVAICYIVVIMDIGLLVGFGRSPYSSTPFGITINIILVASTLLGMEFSRAAIVKSFSKKRPFLAIGLVAILYTFMGISTARLLSLSGPLEFTNFLGVMLLPLIAESILATYLALTGGPVASLAYRAPLMAFWWFSPILPNLSWGVEALVGVMTPAIGFFVINQFVSPITLRRAGIPAELKRFGRPKKSSWRSWMFVSVLCVALVWSTTGLLGVRATTVISSSMSPAMEVGDMTIVQEVAPGSIGEGDIIQFWRDGEMVMHRVVDVYDEGNITLFVTQGDANSTIDMSPVQPSQVVGKVVLNIPKIGWAVITTKNFVAGVWSFISANAVLVALVLTSGVGAFYVNRSYKNRSTRRWGSKWRKRKFSNQRLMVPLSAILILMAVSGLAYSHWSETLYISGTVTTGKWVDAIVRITPRTLNLKNEDKWMTCHIELPEGYDVADIDIGSIRLNDVIPAEPDPTGGGGKKLMVKFSRSAIQAIVSVGEADIKVTGYVGSVYFEGWDTIRVIDPSI